MKQLATSSALVFAFSLYILFFTPDVVPKEVAAVSSGMPSSTPNIVPGTAKSSTAAPSSKPTPASAPAPKPAGTYKDGTYTGSVADAFYGNVQVAAVVNGGKITDVQFLQYPNDRSNSIAINSQAMPYLTEEAIQAQSANVNIVSGATDTSTAFIQSLGAALARARA